MNPWKLSLAFGMVGASAVSHATFEMLFAPSDSGRIFRLDPESNVPLGSYAASPSPIKSVAYDSILDRTTILDSTGRVRSQNPHTGSTLLSGAYLGGTALIWNESTQKYLYGLATGVRALRSTDLFQLHSDFTLPAGVNYVSGVSFGNTSYLVGINTSSQTVIQPVNMQTYAYGATATISTVAANAISNLMVIGSNVFWMANQAGTLVMRRSSISSTTIGSSLALTTTFTDYNSVTGTAPGLALGHNTFYVAGRSSSAVTTTRVRQYDLNIVPSLIQTYERTGLDPVENGHYAIINAPEPLTMVALGAGLIGLLRRRRK